MKREIPNLQTRLYLITAIILLAGLGSALLIYLRAGNDLQGVLGYEAAGGHVYPISPEDSKMYIHDLELYGGKLNVLADEFMRWFAGLWHGKSLAFTVACITIVTSLGLFFVAHAMQSDGGAEDNRPNYQSKEKSVS